MPKTPPTPDPLIKEREKLVAELSVTQPDSDEYAILLKNIAAIDEILVKNKVAPKIKPEVLLQVGATATLVVASMVFEATGFTFVSRGLDLVRKATIRI